MRAALLPRRKRKQVSKLQVRYDYVAEPGCAHDKTDYCVHKTDTHNDKMDLKFTDLSFSSGEESSPHNTGPLGAERLYLRIPCTFIYYYTDTELSKLRLSPDCTNSLYR